MIPKEIISDVEVHLSQMSGDLVTVESHRPISGGSINQAFELKTNDKSFFIKYNLDALYPGMFEVESRGLNLLRTPDVIGIPEVIRSGQAGKYGYLLLEMLTPGPISKTFFYDLGCNLAKLHEQTAAMFGLDHNNYIGSLKQINTSNSSFASFFIESRLMPLVSKAQNSGQLNSQAVSQFEKMYNKLDGFFPKEPPALLHGDLWSGNRTVGPDGNAWLIDPAVYYGHRETDVAMTMLFGGFDSDFYRGYNEQNPLQLGWKDRVDVHNLYPLLVHLNLFGEGYLSQIQQIIRRF